MLCDLFVTVGPDAPTLCGSWTTRDLAAHLLVRESRPDAAIGIVASPLESYSEKVRRAAAERPWDELVDAVRNGPPRWSPMRIDAVDRLANTVEFYVHHEDVRRAQVEWEPRPLDDELEHTLWSALVRMARLLVRRAPCGLVLSAPGGREVTAKKGEPAVTVHGAVGELVLFAYGRQAQARVEVTAPDEMAEALRTARFGI